MRIFISYRRSDAAGHAGRLFDWLKREFPHPVFMDTEGIRIGSEFPVVLKDEVEHADVLIALIGPRWLSVEDDAGRPRIEKNSDYVRRELEIALANGVGIIPVLVWGATMPSQRDLPKSIQSLAQRHAIELTDSGWRADVAKLIDTLRTFSWRPERRPNAQQPKTAKIVTEFELPETVKQNAFNLSGTVIASENYLLIVHSESRFFWFVETQGNRIAGKRRTYRGPFWRPVAASAGLGHVWVADALGDAIWAMRPTLNYSYKDAEEETPPKPSQITPSLKSTRCGGIGGSPVSVAAGGVEPGQGVGVWVIVADRRRGASRSGGKLLRLDPSTLKIEAVFEMPHPRRVAIGAGAVWAIAADLLIKVDVERNVIERTIPLGFEATAITVCSDTVWVGGENKVARIDALTSHVEGQIWTPHLFCNSLASSNDSLWVAGSDEVHRVNMKTHDIEDSLKVGVMIGSIWDMAHYAEKLYVGSSSNAMGRPIISVIDMNAGQ